MCRENNLKCSGKREELETRLRQFFRDRQALTAAVAQPAAPIPPPQLVSQASQASHRGAMPPVEEEDDTEEARGTDGEEEEDGLDAETE